MNKNIILLLTLFIICVACDKNLYKENNQTQKVSIIIGETDDNNKNKENTKIVHSEKSNESEVLVTIKKGYGDISKNKIKLIENAKILFTFSDDDEKGAILLVKNENYTTEELIEELKKIPEVINVEPNYNLNAVYTN